jgi:hypothetical protein
MYLAKVRINQHLHVCTSQIEVPFNRCPDAAGGNKATPMHEVLCSVIFVTAIHPESVITLGHDDLEYDDHNEPR